MFVHGDLRYIHVQSVGVTLDWSILSLETCSKQPETSSTVSFQKKTLIFDWTVLEDQEELEAVLWTRFRVVSPGSEIVWKLSETVSCSRTTERAEKPWFQKRDPPHFFLHRHAWAKEVTFSVSRLIRKTLFLLRDMKFSQLPPMAKAPIPCPSTCQV